VRLPFNELYRVGKRDERNIDERKMIGVVFLDLKGGGVFIIKNRIISKQRYSVKENGKLWDNRGST